MDFSESYKISLGPEPAYSPDGRFLATSVEYRLIIREVESLRVVQIYACLDRVEELSWSANSLYVLCGLPKRGILQLFAVDDPSFSCKIDEGPAGIQRSQWAPDGLSVVVIAQFQLRTTVWSLQERKCRYLRGPKHPEKGFAFSADGTRLAMLERYDCKDYLTLYDARTWQQLSHVPCDTSDAADLAWAPDGNHVAVWDSCLNYRVQLFNGDGSPQALYSAYSDALGVKTVAWSAGGELLAVGSYDERVRVLNTVTWQPLLEGSHSAGVAEPPHVVVYREVDEAVPGPLGLGSTTPVKSPSNQEVKSKYVIEALPAAVPTGRPSLDTAFPKIGVGKLSWSPDSQFLLTINDAQPGTAWVWDMSAMELCAVLIHGSPLKHAAWSPTGCMLALVAGASKVYLWTPGGASIVHVPLAHFHAHALTWSPRGSGFALTDKDAFCCAYLAGGGA